MGAPQHNAGDAGSPRLIFDWRGGERIRWTGWLAMLVVGGCFVLSVLAIRVRVSPPVAWAVPQAEMIFLSHDSEAGRRLGRRAQSQGPFPSRFEPSEWAGLESLESEVMAATRTPRTPYHPELRPFPQADGGRAPLASRGEPVLPERTLGVVPGPDTGSLVWVPVIEPVSGWRDGDLLLPMPEFKGVVDAAAARPWRFMLKVDAQGRVRECISLAGAGEPAVVAVTAWLKRLRFAAGVADRWVSLSVEFKNQVVSDGTGAE